MYTFYLHIWIIDFYEVQNESKFFSQQKQLSARKDSYDESIL